ncbi:hypothetical protein [Bradyrhizobium valentinum]|uniref:Secreted protein n=1 Tax=Bradyrhizobium valentinum TaxID=1518501 RepID=A0A0R3LNP3_9BRAD|nr:hypothetical protein [Bradyrhizobium valentinum]KRR08532.1 hypothetical protein CP49_24940 [Bradyrhizobium valentinum]KRR09404.1 hypothetical protein CQ10_13140 [Bradyrhizobium valentinum]
MVAKISMMAGAVVLALGLMSPVVTNAVCIDEPCGPPRPATGAGWRMANFPAPNGGVVAYRIMGSNAACASYDGRNCLWGMKVSQIDFDRVRPLVCGANHRAAWGVTGYEDRRHWCNLARRVVSTD